MKTPAIALAALLLGALPAAADSDPAVQTVQSFYDTLTDTMKHGKALGLNGRYEKLKPAVEQAYDLADMTKVVVGASWPSLSASDQQALIAAFERMTIANYAKNFDDYSGEKFVVGLHARSGKILERKIGRERRRIEQPPRQLHAGDHGAAIELLDQIVGLNDRRFERIG